MDKTGKFITGFAETWQKGTKIFMALPFILKLFLAPIIFVFSFTIILPIIAVVAVSYKGIKTIVGAIASIWRARNNLFKLTTTIIVFSVLSIILFGALIFAVVLFFNLFPKMPVLVKWMILAMSGFMIILLYVLGKDTNSEIKNFIQQNNELDFRAAKDIIAEASGNNADKNPLVWLLSGSTRLLFAGAFLLSGGIVVLLIFAATLNILIPGSFFQNTSQSQHFLVSWLIFLAQQMLRVIPIEFLSPFLPEIKTFDIIRPWGNVLMIFIQTGITFLLYISVFTIYGVYKYNKQRTELISDKKHQCSIDGIS